MRTTITPVPPRPFLALDDAALKSNGFSRLKTAYSCDPARAIPERRFRPAALQIMSDEAARDSLVQLKDIGVWSAETYLLRALRRPGIRPKGDLVFSVAAQQIKQLASRPNVDEVDTLGVLGGRGERS